MDACKIVINVKAALIVPLLHVDLGEQMTYEILIKHIIYLFQGSQLDTKTTS